ncbi:hypothetical protein PCASD_08392 [Puccinia coronata f. sp. avenae]|uniref:Uncharacterized protein n=1 Tax=Puccinia coronata f. sp. avenae TaxID=200324 RepID=A0A2N5TG45_9BASI|nr:hypothetical protein PCASD_08392 [Puccinia coronata f. sp. avenae]
MTFGPYGESKGYSREQGTSGHHIQQCAARRVASKLTRDSNGNQPDTFMLRVARKLHRAPVNSSREVALAHWMLLHDSASEGFFMV